MNKRRVKGQKQAKTSKTLFLWGKKKKRGKEKKNGRTEETKTKKKKRT